VVPWSLTQRACPHHHHKHRHKRTLTSSINTLSLLSSIILPPSRTDQPTKPKKPLSAAKQANAHQAPSNAMSSSAMGGSGSAGNEEGICVAIRARPMSSKEKLQGQRALWRCLPAHNSITLTGPDGNPLPDRNPGFGFFTYDKVFSENASTSDVYQAIGRPIVSSVLQGFNGTIFAYGQTSSGT